MITEETGKRIAVALETLIVLLEKVAHPPVVVPPSPVVDMTGRCFFCGKDHGNSACQAWINRLSVTSDMEGR